MIKNENIINQIKDILYKEGITGLDSIKHCLLFIFIKFLNASKCDQYNIDPIYSFEQISSLTDENAMKAIIFIKDKPCLVNFLKQENIFSIDFKLQSAANLKTIIGKILLINVYSMTNIIDAIYDVHIKGNIYQSLHDFSKYFINHKIIEWMLNLTNPKIANIKTGEIEKILVPSMGSCCFLTMVIKHLNKSNKINWDTNKNNIYGFDIDKNIAQISLLNTFIETGILFGKTIIKHDSLHKDFILKDGTFIDKVDVILSNEPFSLKNITHAECCVRIKQLKIRGTKSEPLFLQLIMSSLNEGGRCAIIVPDNVLFNDSNLHTRTREYLVKNLNLKKVIRLNDEIFLNTGVKLSILYFINNGKTTEIEFSELIMDKSNELKENPICKVVYDDIIANDYSLFVNKYNIVEEKKLNGIEYMKLGDICDIKFGTKIKKSEVELENSLNESKYRCYSNEDISFYMKEFNREGLNLIVTRFGISENCVRIINEKIWLTDSYMTLHVKNENCCQQYINYYLNHNQNIIYNLVKSSNQKNINIDDFKKLKIPIPSMEKQKEIIKILDIFNEQIERNIQSIKAYEHIKNSIILTNTTNCTNIKKLINICNINSRNISKEYPHTIIKYIDTCSINNNLIFQEFSIGSEPSKAKRIVKLSDILLPTIRPNFKNILYIDNNLHCENLVASTSFITLTSKSINSKYIYYYLLLPKTTEYFVKNLTNSIYSSINTDIILNYKIPVPSNEIIELIIKENEYWDKRIIRLKKENKKLKDISITELCLVCESTNPNIELCLVCESTNPNKESQLTHDEQSEPKSKSKIEI